MTSDKKNIGLLTDLFVKSGLSNIVLSPGSRNAPIILSFANRNDVNAFNIVDERSAAFFALGIALKTNKTTAIACTSGSAVLNYSSAIAEAYYQKIPLLVLTADRPKHLIDVGDGQTIRQNKVFKNFIKKSYQLPENIDSDSTFTKAEKIINKALQKCMFPEPGPVHINIPFDEPIYGTTDETITGKLLKNMASADNTPNEVVTEVIDKIVDSKKIMIITGQQRPDNELNKLISEISNNDNIIVLSETTSNLYCENFIDTIDNVVSTFNDEDSELFKPDILISFGGQVVSKMIKKFLRKNKPNYHWHISPSGEKMDTYFSLTEAIKYEVSDFFKLLNKTPVNQESNYSKSWHHKRSLIDQRNKQFISDVKYSDLKVFDIILKNLPDDSVLHLGNSTPVRYSQLFGSRKNIEYNSNRGVSGIDGQVSSAAGYAYYSDKLNILITGDLGFLYDSNGFMNHYLKPQLKIIVINNQGGGIFRFIPGPDTTPNLEKFFEAKHNWKTKHICKAFGVNYHSCEDEMELEISISKLLSDELTSVLEIFTPSEENGNTLRDYFKYIKG